VNPVLSLFLLEPFFYGVCFFGSHLSFRDFSSFSGFLDAQTHLLLLSFIALRGYQSCNYHILVDFVVTFSGFLDAQTHLLLLSFIALRGYQSCNYHILVDFVVTVAVCRLGKLQW
jgi:hypothetical protein